MLPYSKIATILPKEEPMSAFGKESNERSSSPLDSPEVRHTIRRIAYEHGMTLNEAKIFYVRHQND